MKHSILNNVLAYVEHEVRNPCVLDLIHKHAGLTVLLSVPLKLDWDISPAEINEHRGCLRIRAEFTFGDNHKGCVDIYVKTMGDKVHGQWELQLDYTAEVYVRNILPEYPSVPVLKLAKIAA